MWCKIHYARYVVQVLDPNLKRPWGCCGFFPDISDCSLPLSLEQVFKDRYVRKPLQPEGWKRCEEPTYSCSQEPVPTRHERGHPGLSSPDNHLAESNNISGPHKIRQNHQINPQKCEKIKKSSLFQNRSSNTVAHQSRLICFCRTLKLKMNFTFLNG